MPLLHEWQNFYMIVGSAAGALTGLQFVVMALIADMPMREGEGQAANAFATPTIIHFTVALMLSAVVAMPWYSLMPATIVWSLIGLSGLVYAIRVILRMLRQKTYETVFEDWLFHAILPVAAYLTITVAPLVLLALEVAFRAHILPQSNGLQPNSIARHVGDVYESALYSIAFAALLLLAIAIHNAWDNVTYLVIMRRERLGLDTSTDSTQP